MSRQVRRGWTSWRDQERYTSQTPEQREAGYRRWRAMIPFADEEIASQLEREAEAFEATGMRADAWLAKTRRIMAAQARKGRLSRVALTLALDALVKVCAVCGRTAIYRLGCRGRCSDHRDVPDGEVERARFIKSLRATALATEKDTLDRFERRASARRKGRDPRRSHRRRP